MRHSKKITVTVEFGDNNAQKKKKGSKKKRSLSGQATNIDKEPDFRLHNEDDEKAKDTSYDDGAYPWWVEYFGIDKSFFHYDDEWEEDLDEEDDQEQNPKIRLVEEEKECEK